MTALMWASSNNQLLTVELLLKQGAYADIRTKNSISALLLASAQGHYEIVSALLQHGAEINQISKVLSLSSLNT